MFSHRYGQALEYLIGVNHKMRVINDGGCYTNWISRDIEKAIGRIKVWKGAYYKGNIRG